MRPDLLTNWFIVNGFGTVLDIDFDEIFAPEISRYDLDHGVIGCDIQSTYTASGHGDEHHFNMWLKNHKNPKTAR